eukprot:Seg2085.4 transcript_id=Seg2085.4/GoldUCD/mRNA.D3Y31 product="Spliceosome-associated protein CWC27" protein_id=Seg2085.4/GoldUCD/D3Y31
MSNIYIQEPPTNGKVLLDTSVGDIDVELWSKEAPKACRNFVQLCMEGYYDNTIFHRIVKGFIAQGGDPTGTGYGGESIYGRAFKDEFHQRLRFNRRGLVGMANSGPNDNKSQFFFTLDRAEELDKKHTIFGKVGGNTIYNMIRLTEIEVDANDRPLEPPKIHKTEILYNPFDDIEPRTKKEDNEKKNIEKEKGSKKKRSKNFKLLSFGEEAEEDDEEVSEISKSITIKSSHDALQDPKLSKEPAVDDTQIQDERRASEKVKEKLTKKSERRAREVTPEEEEAMKKRKRKEALKEEAKKIKKELAEQSKRKEERLEEKVGDEIDNETNERGREVNDLMQQLKEERTQFLKQRKEKPILKKGGNRESETLALLAGFQSHLSSNINDINDSTNEEETVETDLGWMSHQLKFESHEAKAKDANIRDEDTFDIYDPRNPINERRRKSSKQKKGQVKG